MIAGRQWTLHWGQCNAICYHWPDIFQSPKILMNHGRFWPLWEPPTQSLHWKWSYETTMGPEKQRAEAAQWLLLGVEVISLPRTTLSYSFIDGLRRQIRLRHIHLPLLFDKQDRWWRVHVGFLLHHHKRRKNSHCIAFISCHSRAKLQNTTMSKNNVHIVQ